MSSYLTPDKLPQGSSVTFHDSSFFKHGPEQPKPPTPSEVLARPNYIQHPCAEGWRIRQPAMFKELGLVVKHSQDSIPVPEVYSWTQENGVTFLYMEYIDGFTLHDRWDTLSAIEKDGVCEQLRKMVTKVSHLRQAPNDQFIGSITRGAVRDRVFTDTDLPPVGSFSSVAEFHHSMSDMFKLPAKFNEPDLDPADIMDPYRETLPDDCPIHFTHADLNPVNIMVTKDSPCRVTAIVDWEQSGWYPAYWEFCKAELTIEPYSEWQAVYLPKILDEPDCIESFYSYTRAYGP